MPTTMERGWIKMGAAARLREIADEQQAITRHFPDLAAPAPASPPPTRRRRRRRMSAAARQAISRRMRAYWAAQRKAAKKR